MTASESLHRSDHAHELLRAFAKIARQLASQDNLQDAVGAVVHFAQLHIPGADAAAVTTHAGGKLTTIGATSDLPRAVDAIQFDAQEGPSLASLQHGHAFRSDDLLQEPRWPTFAARAATETGVRSMLCQRLFLEEETTIGALNLYARSPHAFREESVALADVYATHAAIALARVLDVEKAHNLEKALHTNRDIGVAIGILMANFKITKAEAFDLLRVLSQHSHRKLNAVAADVVETGTIELPK